MDSITQAVLGASVQAALLGRWQGRKALLYGAMLGTLPDLDVIIDYGDAVANMTQHRGFSHSLLVLSLFSVLLAWLVRRFFPDAGYSGRRLLLSIWLVLVTHVLLDAFTSYGTQLFWPLQTPPVAWSSIFIIDPLYSLPLLLAVLITGLSGLGGRRRHLPLAALALSSLYLGSTLAGKQMAERRMHDALARQGVEARQVFSAPTPFNTLLWRMLAVDDEYYYEAVTSWFDRKPPVLVPIARGAEKAEALQHSSAHERLRWFSGGLLRYDEIDGQLVVTDLRLGMTGVHPFRFPLAEYRTGTWVVLERPQRLPAERGDLRQLERIWQRIWQARPELPLAQWAAPLARSNGDTANR
ncbi:metal-dependent hydrolase [Stutzerimonas kirkiae]|uniref:Hydrolase n=1 Tax=Stutzerimonas kirkiae TaxID=2211392 RepID=A0A4Q9RFR7_9GAMM|nr:metal-dependent hydrolase [Stutzerimonas kirkiae]TBV00058.1 hydrolase [Stutzerimonas kirkiae]TBV05764.1 hydrolase [Stutzerimonas kirkiae]TBV09559.1 hydrolase [Stutzerimonas kirkiae]TBV17359.1 hydrolase [Stutzerimonas kirkiae]